MRVCACCVCVRERLIVNEGGCVYVKDCVMNIKGRVCVFVVFVCERLIVNGGGCVLVKDSASVNVFKKGVCTFKCVCVCLI